VRFIDGAPDHLEVWNAANTARLALATASGVRTGNVVPASGAVFNATMVQSGAAITVTLGTLASGGVNGTSPGTATLQWFPSSTALDLAGNAASTTSRNETGTVDVDF
jgi:hypothetical protein